ncbi:MAG: TIGR01777 family oxidoreductase [Flavobacteriales bacterium]
MKEKVLITGANGSLAKKVKVNFESQGFEVVSLTSKEKNADGLSTFFWDTSKGFVDENALKGVHHIIHLAGFSIIEKWTDDNKKKMYDSRIKAANLLFESCNKLGVQPKTFVTASAIGFYGLDDPITLKKETDKPADDWMANMCVDWEQSAQQFSALNTRVVQLRISLLLTKKAGFLAPTLLSMKLGSAVVFGSGKQPIEWIHIDDASSFIDYAVKNEVISGPYNLGSNHKLTQYEFMKLIKKIVAPYSILIKIPSFMLKMIFGKRSVILEGGCKMDMTKFNNSGFVPTYPTLDLAIQKEMNG